MLYDFLQQPSLPVEFHASLDQKKPSSIINSNNLQEVALPSLKKYFPRLTHTFLCLHLLAKSLKITN